MEFDKTNILANFLNAEEIKCIPNNIHEKLTKFIGEAYEEIITSKASNESAKSNLEEARSKYEQKIQELQLQVDNYDINLKNLQLSVDELRNQINIVTLERDNLLEQTNKYENELSTIRREKNNISDERDSLLKIVERQNSGLERLQEENKIFQQQLKAAINAKCEALARVDEVESKESALDFKEKHMEQERLILTTQIQRLSEDLNRNITELQNIRGENTIKNMHMEAKFQEKLEELKIVNAQSLHYKESVETLTKNIQELNNKMLAQTKESNKMMEYYKKELEAKSKLADIYKTNCEDSLVESNELGSAITDLKRMLAEASGQYGELETKLKTLKLQHEQEILEKNKIIDSQKTEIINANSLLSKIQYENVECALNKLAPSAAVANRLIKSDMSLTELYSLYVKTNEENEHHKRDNNRLSLQLKTILQELEDRAPILKKQEVEFQKLVETKTLLSQQLEEMIAVKADDLHEIQELQIKITYLERENKKLKHSQSDLSRQMCFLLKEVEQQRYNSSSNTSHSVIGNLITTDEVITKKLVTFKDISELQENNQKLLLLVRDLSLKLEESESVKFDLSENANQEKVESFIKKNKALQDSLQNQTKMLNAYMAKCERYKNLYFEAFYKNGDSQQNCVSSHENYDELEETKSDLPKFSRKDVKEKEKRIAELEDQLLKVNDKLKANTQQYEYYITEKKTNEKILNEQFDAMRTEVRELTKTNCKLMSSVDYNKQQIKILNKNNATYKQQINALESRNKNYENTIIKHEQTVLYLKDEIIKSQKELSAVEVEANFLRQENQMVKDSIARLQSEKEIFYRAKQSQNLLLNNLEIIKTSFERSEMEGRTRLEGRLDEMSRELAAQRRRYQEEQDRFRDLASDLKQQTNTAKERMEEEKMVAEKLQEQIIILRDELAAKSRQIDELSKKLQDCLMPSQSDNPIALANKKIKDMEFKLEEIKLEKNSLCAQLENAREHSEQYFKISQSAENEIKNLHELYSKTKLESENEIRDLKEKEVNLKSRIEELETEVQLHSIAEAQLQIEGNRQPQQLTKLQEELKDVLQKLGETTRELRAVRCELHSTSELLNAVEQKYANEMVLHSADIQQLAKLKEELTKNREQINCLKKERDDAVKALEQKENDSSQTKHSFDIEKEKLVKRLIDLDTQNSLLHNQIETLSSKFSILESSEFSHVVSANNSLNENIDANKSETEEECKTNEQLLQIIKFLRKEKDISVAKIDILKSENIRIMTEFNILKKKNDELNGFLNQERTKSETGIVTANRHEEILRKIETLNAVTDSNRILREERDLLTHRVKDLKEHINKIEDDLIPLQKHNRELLTKIEELSTENNSLKTEAIKWRQRANLLVEKSNKNPEEFKRLQSERENLAKMLTSEKDQIKKITEELCVVKNEKSKLESEVASLGSCIKNQLEEKKKLLDDLASVKQINTRMTQEVMEMKTKLLQKEELLQKLSEELESKEVQLQDSKNKEVQIRKIAKRYKDSFIDLSNKMSNANNEGNTSNISSQDNIELTSAVLGANSNEGTTPVTASASATSSKIETEKDLRNKIESLSNSIKTTQEEYEKIRKENEELKSTSEKDERGKSLLREAKSRIMTLTESKIAMTQELASTKTILQSYKQSSEDHDAVVNSIKAQYEESLNRMQKEQADQTNQSKEIISRLSRENESLLLRINQLYRQLGLQQAIKPSTSSGAVSDKSSISESCSPRTANVKPLSGSSGQQSATVTPWRGGDTPLASIRPITVQSSRTAAVLPTSQNNILVVQGSSSCNPNNTALVPPQQQVHTTGSNIESLSSSPTSSHIDYMPSTSSAAVAVAAVPPMGVASAAESSQEAESVLIQNCEPQLIMNIGQQQVVALVSPRVEGSMQNSGQSTQETNNQPSTSGTSSSLHASINTQSRHASSSSNVTTTQATASHKRPREAEGYNSTAIEDCEEKTNPKNKRTRTQLKIEQSSSSQVGFTESVVDVEYQVPTSSQRDQEDDIIVVDSEEDDGMVDEGNAEAEEPLEEGENEAYEDSYEQNHDIDEHDCAEIEEIQMQVDNNEVEIVQSLDALVQFDSANHNINLDATTSQLTKRTQIRLPSDSNKGDSQQIQAISSVSGEVVSNEIQSTVVWKQSPSFTRQHKATPTIVSTESEEMNQFEAVSQISESSSLEANVERDDEAKSGDGLVDENTEAGEGTLPNMTDRNTEKTPTCTERSSSENSINTLRETQNQDSVCAFAASEEVAESRIQEANESETQGASQSEPSQITPNQGERTTEDSEFIDSVSSEGEKAVVEDVEEEGREAEASTSPSVNTRSKSIRSTVASRRLSRGCQRGGRPTPIIWQDQSHESTTQRNQEQPGSPSRVFQNQRTQRARRIRRPGGSNYGNMRY